ncbi:hypothetical protein ACEPAH_1659 [Sanghuangporus vaninii]
MYTAAFKEGRVLEKYNKAKIRPERRRRYKKLLNKFKVTEEESSMYGTMAALMIPISLDLMRISTAPVLILRPPTLRKGQR